MSPFGIVVSYSELAVGAKRDGKFGIVRDRVGGASEGRARFGLNDVSGTQLRLADTARNRRRRRGWPRAPWDRGLPAAQRCACRPGDGLRPAGREPSGQPCRCGGALLQVVELAGGRSGHSSSANRSRPELMRDRAGAAQAPLNQTVVQNGQPQLADHVWGIRVWVSGRSRRVRSFATPIARGGLGVNRSTVEHSVPGSRRRHRDR